MRAIRRIIRSVDIYSHRLSLECGLTVPQLTCLMRIVESGPLSLKALANAVDLSSSTTVGIVDRLAAKGLARRDRSEQDRRQVLLTATPQGVAVAGSAPSPLHARLAEGLKALPVVKRESLARAIENVVELMAIRPVEAAPILGTGLALDAETAQAQQPAAGEIF